MSTDTEKPLADDLLPGVKAIAQHIGEPEKRVFYMLEKGQIPGRRVGRRWYSTRSALAKAFSVEVVA